VLALSLGIFALALVAPIAANAQVTIVHIRVTEGPSAADTSMPSQGAATASYCDGSAPGGCKSPIWNLGSGILLNAGQMLILTQAQLAAENNFDTSEREGQTDSTVAASCNGGVTGVNAGHPCKVVIELDTGSGWQTVYTNDPCATVSCNSG